MSQQLTPPSKGTTPAPPSDMAPPATPSGRDRSAHVLPRTPGSSTAGCGNLNTPGGRAIPHSSRTPGGSLRACTADKAGYNTVTVHTAKCTECDQRNKETMLRCPGCTFQICKPCRERREKKNKGLEHGNMFTPGGMQGLSAGGLGGGGFRGLMSGRQEVTRKKLPVLHGSLSPSPAAAKREIRMLEEGEEDREHEDGMWSDGTNDSGLGPSKSAKGKEKAVFETPVKSAAKKRAARARPTAGVADESSDDEYKFDVNSPTANKKRRTTLGLTDSPTATSTRPSRRTSIPNHGYVLPSSPGSEESPVEFGAAESSRAAETRRMTENSRVTAESSRAAASRYKDPHRSWNVGEQNPPQIVPDARMQELLELHGVNTPGNRYQEHFLSRRLPAMSNPTIAAATNWRKKHAEQQQEARAKEEEEEEEEEEEKEEKEDADEKARREQAIKKAYPFTVRGFAEIEAKKYLGDVFEQDEKEELFAKLLADARKWGVNIYKQALTPAERQTVQRGFKLRLDKINPSYKTELVKLIETKAHEKIKEFEEDRHD